MKCLWLAVTADKYELPLYVADTARELAGKFGISIGSLVKSAHREDTGRNSGRRFIKLELDDKDTI